MAKLRSDLRVKSFEVERLAAQYEQTSAGSRRGELESDAWREKLEVNVTHTTIPLTVAVWAWNKMFRLLYSLFDHMPCLTRSSLAEHDTSLIGSGEKSVLQLN